MQVRYLQKMGIDLSSAVAAGGVLSAVGNLIAALGLFVLAVVIAPTQTDFSLLPTTGLLELTVIVIVVVVLASALVLAVPRLRRVTLPPVQRASSTMLVVLRSPYKLTLLVGGNVIATLLSTACLAACVAAFGASVSFWSLLAANIAVVTVASIVPIPGGGTAVGTVGLSAVLVSFGIPDQIAVAAALTNQLVVLLPARDTRLVRHQAPLPAGLPMSVLLRRGFLLLKSSRRRLQKLPPRILRRLYDALPRPVALRIRHILDLIERGSRADVSRIDIGSFRSEREVLVVEAVALRRRE